LTELLHRWSGGDESAFAAAIELAYDRLHRIARRHAHGERDGHTLQPTAILHEALLRLMDMEGLPWADRAHFYAVAARTMRRVLVDYARERNRQKRGGDQVRVPLDAVFPHAAERPAPAVEALDEALERLEARDPRQARVVELRFFVGLTGEETARCLGVSAPTVQRDWRRARTWLYLDLTGERLDG
jgi:RNA polymerase sigma factor (TIGR02999 family)